MNILDNELVLKYFGCNEKGMPYTPVGMSELVLLAMQEPIRKGERYLIWNSAEVVEEIMDFDGSDDIHPSRLRLPQRFQGPAKKECSHCVGHKCCGCGYDQPPPHDIAAESEAGRPMEDAVEEEIGKIVRQIVFEKGSAGVFWSDILRELVKLAKETK